ncbi:hypothetical protein QTP70_010231, partial [Hemibagrus guttatus]
DWTDTIRTAKMSNPDPVLVDALRRTLTSTSTPAPPVTTSAFTAAPPSPSAVASPMTKPAPFTGSAEDCNGFLLQCSLVLEMQPHLYPDDRTKVAFIISQLDGKALRWAEPLWTQENPVVKSLSSFINHFKEVFGKPAWDSSIGERLCKLKQGLMSVSDYALQFRTLAAASGWNEQALITTYRQGLDPYEDSIRLEKFIQLSIRFATRMQLCLEEHQGQLLFPSTLRQPESVSHPEPANEPMQIENSRLSSAEQQRRLTQNLCLYCGRAGHYISECPTRPGVGPLHLQVGILYTEEIHLLVLEDSTADVILGRPWLEQHKPIISWRTGEILRWGKQCFNDCFPVPRLPSSEEIQVYATSVESPLEKRSTDIPACYSHFSDVFCPKEASKLPPHRPWDCTIDLIHGEPVPGGKIYSLSIPEEKAMEEYINEALSQGYIRPSTSPAASSFFFVAKKDGGLWPCIDYRALNKITIKFRYPLPLVPSALKHLRGATVFTKLDLRCTYNLIRIREGDKWKTAFVTPTSHYEYLVMPYGLVNAPSVFQDFMHEVLQEFLHKPVLVYIDDILIYSRSMADHRQHVAEVLQRLRDYHLFLKAEKCTFHQPSVQFLGYNIDRSGVCMDERKVTAAKDWPIPTLVKELQTFLGFANFYRRFIQGFSSITSPLTSLLRNKPKSLSWTPAAMQAFDTLKIAFTTAPLLAHPDPDLPFVVEVDAPTTGVGAVLSQQQANSCKLHPCAFFSHKLNPAEVNYDIGNRELLAIKLALEEWSPEESTDDPEPIIPEKLFVSPITWSEETLPESNASTSTPPGCPQGLQYIPRTRCTPLIHSSHTSLGTGHPGVNETLSLLKQCFWWPNMASDVRRYVQGCWECAISKSPRHLPSGKLQPLPVPNRPWSHLGVDFITDLPVSNGCTCVLVVVDRFSKSCRLIPLPGLPTAMDTAELMFNYVFRYYGLPEDIVSDRGSQFTSRVWRSFFKLLGVTISLSSGYHPQTNGQTERKIQEIGRFLRTFCHGHKDSWNQFLGWAEYAQNSLHQPTTGLTPFQCVLGYQPPLFPWDGEPSDVPAVDYWFRESERVWDSAHLQLQ